MIYLVDSINKQFYLVAEDADSSKFVDKLDTLYTKMDYKINIVKAIGARINIAVPPEAKYIKHEIEE